MSVASITSYIWAALGFSADAGQVRQERDEAISQLSSNACWAHSPPDPLHCDTCNRLLELTAALGECHKLLGCAEGERDALVARLADCGKTVFPLLQEIVSHLQVAQAELTLLQQQVARLRQVFPQASLTLSQSQFTQLQEVFSATPLAPSTELSGEAAGQDDENE